MSEDAAQQPTKEQRSFASVLPFIAATALVLVVAVVTVVWLAFFRGPEPGSLRQQAIDSGPQAAAMAAYHTAFSDFLDSTTHTNYQQQQDYYTQRLIQALSRASKAHAFTHERAQSELYAAIALMRGHCRPCVKRLRLARADF